METIQNQDLILLKTFDDLQYLESYIKTNLADTFIRTSRPAKCSFSVATKEEKHFMNHEKRITKTIYLDRFSVKCRFAYSRIIL